MAHEMAAPGTAAPGTAAPEALGTVDLVVGGAAARTKVVDAEPVCVGPLRGGVVRREAGCKFGTANRVRADGL